VIFEKTNNDLTRSPLGLLNSSHDAKVLGFKAAIVIWRHSNTNEVSFGDEHLR
jgi:hypothetical protein